MRTGATCALVTLLIGAAMTVNAKPYAIFHTDKGDIVCELYGDKSPKTVENFTGLATGKKKWQHPVTREVMENKPLYNGTNFHRSIANFMIQAGDPKGDGTGQLGPEVKVPDEYPDVKFDRPGRLAMANRGPNTAQSQFFITVATAPHLNTVGHYTIFGQVVQGQEVANAISEMPNKPRTDAPLSPVVLKSVEIVDEWPQVGKADSQTTATADNAPTTATDDNKTTSTQ